MFVYEHDTDEEYFTLAFKTLAGAEAFARKHTPRAFVWAANRWCLSAARKLHVVREVKVDGELVGTIWR